jgi:hypothetical protein
LGEQFDERLIMQPGMVLVFEPVIWEEGFAGYVRKTLMAVTDMGWSNSAARRTTVRADRAGPVARDRGVRRHDGPPGRRTRRLLPACVPNGAQKSSPHGSHDLDALMLGGSGDVCYVSGAANSDGPVCSRSRRSPWRYGKPDACICSRRGTRSAAGGSAATICTA